MIRTYGKAPYTVAVIHGGPGDVGSLSCVAQKLSAITGVIEPIQSKYTIAQLIDELNEQLNSITQQPLILIGHSWGAWLVILYAAHYPEKVNHVVLVGSGPFEDRFVSMIQARRMAKLSTDETALFNKLVFQLEHNSPNKQDEIMAKLGELIRKTDNYQLDNQITLSADSLPTDGRMYSAIWPQAAKIRSEGKLIETLNKVTSLITVIQGAEDPHPIEGVTEPLASLGIPFQKHLLPFCGHSPFKEKLASQEFYNILKQIIAEIR